MVMAPPFPLARGNAHGRGPNACDGGKPDSSDDGDDGDDDAARVALTPHRSKSAVRGRCRNETQESAAATIAAAKIVLVSTSVPPRAGTMAFVVHIWALRLMPAPSRSMPMT
jgi:hypothetical protein